MSKTQTIVSQMQRALDYGELLKNSNSSFYSSTLGQFEEICVLSQKLINVYSELLGKEPQEIIRIESQVVGTLVEDQSNEILSKLDNLNVMLVQMQQQNVSVETTVVNQVPTQVIIETPEISSTSKESGKLPSTYISDFKNILKEAGNSNGSEFESREAHKLSQLVNQHFSIRFNPKYDKKHIHRFSSKRFKDYLYSWVLAYSQACVEGNTILFEGECGAFLDNVKSGNEKYTNPKSVATIFFNYVKAKKFELKREVLVKAAHLWEELWSLGYNRFEDLDIDDSLQQYVPQKYPSWLKSELFESLKDRDREGPESNSDLSQLTFEGRCKRLLDSEDIVTVDELVDLWKTYIAYRNTLTWDVIQALYEGTKYEEAFESTDEAKFQELFILYGSSNEDNLRSLQEHIGLLNQMREKGEELNFTPIDFFDCLNKFDFEQVDLVELYSIM